MDGKQLLSRDVLVDLHSVEADQRAGYFLFQTGMIQTSDSKWEFFLTILVPERYWPNDIFGIFGLALISSFDD